MTWLKSIAVGVEVTEQVEGLGRVALRRERIVRVELAVGEPDRQHDVDQVGVVRPAVVGDERGVSG